MCAGDFPLPWIIPSGKIIQTLVDRNPTNRLKVQGIQVGKLTASSAVIFTAILNT